MYKLTGVSMPEGLAEREKGADLLHLPCGVVLFLHKLRYSDGVAKDVVLSGHGTCVGNYVCAVRLIFPVQRHMTN